MASEEVLLDKEGRGGTPPVDITAHYASAIEIDASPSTAYGRPSMAGLVLIAIGVTLLWFNPLLGDFAAVPISLKFDVPGSIIIAILLCFAFVALFVIYVGLVLLVLPDTELAIIFDRKSQKIYFAIRQPKMLLPVPRMHGFDWKQVSARMLIQTYRDSAGSFVTAHTLVIHATRLNGKTAKKCLSIYRNNDNPVEVWAWLCEYMNGRAQPPAEMLVSREKYVYGYKDTLLWYMPYLRRPYFTAMRKHHPTATFWKCALAPVIWAWLPLGLLQKAWLDLGLGHTIWPRSIINAIGPILKTRPPVYPEILPEKRYQRRIVDDADTGWRA